MKLPTSMCSGASRHEPPESRSTPRMRSTFDSIPSISAPRETRKRQRSWMCGSQAALPITVSPSASTAAMTTFSVAITLASSRKIGLPRSCGARHLVAAVDRDLGAELLRARGCAGRAGGGRSRRRPAAARSRGRSARAAGPRAGTRRGSGGRAPRRAPSSSTCGGVDPDLVLAHPLDLGADVGEELDHRLDVADARHVRQRHRLLREHARGEDRQRAVLVPRGADGPADRAAAFDDEGLHLGGKRRGHPEAGYRRRPMELTRETGLGHAHALHEERGAARGTRSPSRRRRARTRASFGEDEELWGVTALLHDFDYEIHPTLDKHPQDGAPILREEGYPEEVIEAVLSHAEHLGAARATRCSRRRSSPATSCPASSTRAGSCARPGSRGSSRSR